MPHRSPAAARPPHPAHTRGRYIKTHYTAPRMVVAAAGAVDHAELVKLTGE